VKVQLQEADSRSSSPVKGEKELMGDKLVVLALVFVLSTCLASSAQTPSISPTPQQSFTVCEGEYERNCPGTHEAYTYCGTINAWAQQACRDQKSFGSPRYRLIQLNSIPGNKCGYGVYKVLCD
jgi:hypothetical protein